MAWIENVISSRNFVWLYEQRRLSLLTSLKTFNFELKMKKTNIEWRVFKFLPTRARNFESQRWSLDLITEPNN